MDQLKVICAENDQASFVLFPSLCKGCGLCIEKCPAKTLAWSADLGLYGTPVVEPNRGDKPCNACGICQMVCPDCAIKVAKK